MIKHPGEVSRRSLWALAIFLAAVGFLYGWAPHSFTREFIGWRPAGFYNELTDAFEHGHLYLGREPDKRLISLKDPYDPSANAPFRVNDLSYYEGRYYIYMGAGPAVALFLPFNILTGLYLSDDTGAWLFCIGGASAGCALLLVLRRRCFPEGSPILFGSALLVLVMANGFSAVVQGSLAQHLAIDCAFLFSMLSLLFIANSLFLSERRVLWLALASVAYGVAIASRPNYIFGSLVFVPPLLYGLKQGGPRRAAVDLFAVAAPLILVVGLILAYNKARFGGVFEFGQKYQLGAWNQLKLAYSGVPQVRENLRNYLIGPTRFSPFFPFATAPTWISTGILKTIPWLWLSPIALWTLTRKSVAIGARMMGLSAFILCSCNFLTLIFLPSGNPTAVTTSANARYLVDFLPALLLSVGIGLSIAPIRSDGSRNPVHRALVGCAALLAAISCLFGLSLNMSRFPDESFKPIATLLNWPSYTYLRWRGAQYGPIQATVQFPTGRTGAYEPLLSSGYPDAEDLVFVNYDSPKSIRIGYVSTGFNGPMSPSISLDYGKPHVLYISLGSLYPPQAQGIMGSLYEDQVAYIRRHLAVSIDGRDALKDVVLHHDSLPGQVLIGQSRALGEYCDATFTGRISHVSRLPVPIPTDSELPPPAFGPVRISLKFPILHPAGLREPLLVTGKSQAGDMFTVEYSGHDSIRLALDHWGNKGSTSEWFPIDMSSAHTIEISMGSLFPKTEPHGLNPEAKARLSHLRDTLKVLVDGTTVLDVPQETYDSSANDVTVGLNAIGGSTCGYAFSGKILSTARNPSF